MILVKDVVRDVVSNIRLPFTLSGKSQVNGTTYDYSINKTWYLSEGMSFLIDGNEYTVVSMVRNSSVRLQTFSGVILDNDDYLMPPPYYVHGKYLAVNTELANLQDPQAWNPLIWLFNRTDREHPVEPDTKFESEGIVTLFLMSTADWANYDTEAHFDEVIEPLGTLIQPLKDSIRRTLRITDLRSFNTKNHAKFTTGGDTIAVEGNKVLPDTQSGIEITVDIPIRKDYNCFT